MASLVIKSKNLLDKTVGRCGVAKNCMMNLLPKIDILNFLRIRQSQNRFAEAKAYVGSPGDLYERAGNMQLNLLKMSGALPSSYILEVGCGCLVAGYPIMKYLLPAHYVGIEPNAWLIQAAVEGDSKIKQLINERHPRFLYNTTFDATSVDQKFDFVISHSILSRAATWQFTQFLQALKKVLTPQGIILASSRMSDEFGNLQPNSNHTEWIYPGVSFFSWDTVQNVAAENGFEVLWKREYRNYMVAQAPTHYHDWVEFSLQN
jgi:SAM-dependent methyltransferase